MSKSLHFHEIGKRFWRVGAGTCLAKCVVPVMIQCSSILLLQQRNHPTAAVDWFVIIDLFRKTTHAAQALAAKYVCEANE